MSDYTRHMYVEASKGLAVCGQSGAVTVVNDPARVTCRRCIGSKFCDPCADLVNARATVADLCARCRSAYAMTTHQFRIRQATRHPARREGK